MYFKVNKIMGFYKTKKLVCFKIYFMEILHIGINFWLLSKSEVMISVNLSSCMRGRKTNE